MRNVSAELVALLGASLTLGCSAAEPCQPDGGCAAGYACSFGTCRFVSEPPAGADGGAGGGASGVAFDGGPPRARVGGTVRAIAVGTDGTTYLGGDFWHAGYATGGWVAYQLDGGRANVAMPRVAGGLVYAAAPDGLGGWYLGGTFNAVGGIARQSLAHVTADGEVDGWDPSPNGNVFALATEGAQLFVGGDFTQVSQRPRSGLAAFDGAGALMDGWDVGVAGGEVRALATRASTLYVGGSFGSVAGESRSRLAALDFDGKVAGFWDFGVDGGDVNSLLTVGTTLYVGGTFDTLGGKAAGTSGRSTTRRA